MEKIWVGFSQLTIFEIDMLISIRNLYIENTFVGKKLNLQLDCKQSQLKIEILWKTTSHHFGCKIYLFIIYNFNSEF